VAAKAEVASPRTRLLLVRHGQTPWNVAGRWQGHADPGLTEEGVTQAKELAEAMSLETDRPWTRIFVSDLARARETAAILGAALALPVEADPRLRELDVGEWSGQTRAEIAANDQVQLVAFESGDLSIRPEGGESREELAERVRVVAGELAGRFPEESLIVVTHLGVIRALAPGFEPTNAGRIEVDALAASRGESSRRGAAGPFGEEGARGNAGSPEEQGAL
jgi:broad specificity phosphatase PhoE